MQARFIFFKKLILLFAGFYLCMACEPLPCLERATVRFKLSFFKESSGEVRPAKFPTARFLLSDPVELFSKTSPGLRAISDSSQDLLLPLNGRSGAFKLYMGDSAGTDTLQFWLKSQLEFQNQSCGYFSIYQIDSALLRPGNRLKRIRIANQRIDRNPVAHVELFF